MQWGVEEVVEEVEEVPVVTEEEEVEEEQVEWMRLDPRVAVLKRVEM